MIIAIVSLLAALFLAGCAQPSETALAAPEQTLPAAESADPAAEPAAVADGQPEIESPNGQDQVNGRGNGKGPGDGPGSGDYPPPTGSLTAAEIEGLLFMREEEKLARDVYLAFYDQWGLPIFQNIAGSEQTHMDAVLNVMARYGLEDPASGNGPGIFANPDLQALYDQLTDAGSQAEALRAAAAVEELDIIDLQENLATAESEEVIRVYQKLLAGSENHLRAFVSMLERQTAETYEPQYLSPEAYAAIIGATSGRGNGGSGGIGYGRGGSGSGQGPGGGNGRGRGG
jgi:hypothetical protein